LSAWTVEILLTFAFVFIILCATGSRSSRAAAPLAIGMALTLIHLISIPVTNTSVNPARSTGPALLVGGLALHQLWLFWLAPLAGGILSGSLSRGLSRASSPAAKPISN
jgi:aquaporin Z